MKVTINQKELIKMVQEKIISNIKVEEIILELNLNKHSKDNIYIKENNWYLGSFIEKSVKGENI